MGWREDEISAIPLLRWPALACLFACCAGPVWNLGFLHAAGVRMRVYEPGFLSRAGPPHRPPARPQNLRTNLAPSNLAPRRAAHSNPAATELEPIAIQQRTTDAPAKTRQLQLAGGWEAHKEAVWALAFGGGCLFSGSHDGVIKVCWCCS